MKKGFHIGLRAGEKLYVNGAVLRADRKVSLEFLNDVDFLLEAHVIHAEETTTPLRQLYFVLQTMLIDPSNAASTRKVFDASYALLTASFENAEILCHLQHVRELVESHRLYEALKALRALFASEAAILSNDPSSSKQTLEVA